MMKCIFLIIALSGCLKSFIDDGKIEPQIVLLPKGYIGRVAIIYRQSQGAKTDYTIDHRRLLEVPDCGILKTQFSAPYGTVFSDEEKDYFKFAYFKADGSNECGESITLLTDYNNIDSSAPNKVYVFNRGLGGFSFKNIKYDDVEEFFIDTAKNMSKYRSFNFTQEDLDRCK